MRNEFKLSLSWLGLAAVALLWTTGCGSDSEAGTAVERGGEPPYEYIRPDEPTAERK